MTLPSLILRLTTIILCCLFFACAQGGDDDSNDGSGGGGDGGGSVIEGEGLFTIGSQTNGSGRADATFSLAAGANKFAVNAFSPGGHSLRVTQLRSESGTNYFNPGGLELNLSGEFFGGVISANAPSRSLDPSLQAGDTFQVEVEVASGASGEEVTFVIDSVGDSNLSSGVLNVRIFYVGEVGQDPSSKNAIRAALNEFRNQYGSFGISLNVSEEDLSGSVNLPDPLDGSQLYEQATANTRNANIFVGGDIAGGTGSTLGISGGIPGPTVGSARSAILVSIFAGSGPDGIFSDTEIRVLGETLAHETGHFLGLFHPIDFSGNSVAASDPLTDTASCNNRTSCLGDESLVRNLMFPTTVTGADRQPIPQNQLSSQQIGVLHRAPLVR